MLPSGPRSTYDLPPRPQVTPDAVARQIIATIRDQVARSSDVRTGMMTFGCDGSPVINPLDGSSCNGTGGQKVLFNPQTRTVFGTLGAPVRGLKKTVTVAPGAVSPCTAVDAALKARRRFTDNNGNMYGPTGSWLSKDNPMAKLETDYVHRLAAPRYVTLNGAAPDPPDPRPVAELYIAKVTGVIQSSLLIRTANTSWTPTIWDIPTMEILTHSQDYNSPTTPVLEDAVFGGVYSGVANKCYAVVISTIGGTDTFKWLVYGDAGYSSNISITGAEQALSYGVWVRFGATTGHSLTRSWPGYTNSCAWRGSIYTNNVIIRNGVAVRGTVTEARACVNGGFPNNNIILTSEDDANFSSHALVVRDADSLVQLYRKPLDHDGTSYAFGDPPEKFCFSTNDEGLFAMQCYTVPSLASPPTPYPGHEFGAPNPRKIAVVSVNPLTFEPTILEVITLEDNSYTGGSSFAVMSTV
jgi:hypothetical protein